AVAGKIRRRQVVSVLSRTGREARQRRTEGSAVGEASAAAGARSATGRQREAALRSGSAELLEVTARAPLAGATEQEPAAAARSRRARATVGRGVRQVDALLAQAGNQRRAPRRR